MVQNIGIPSAGQIKISMIGQIHRGVLFRHQPVTDIECIILRYPVSDLQRDTARKPFCCRILPVQCNPVISASRYMKILCCVARASAVKAVAPVIAFKPVTPSVHMKFSAPNPVGYPSYNGRTAGGIPSVFFQCILPQHYIVCFSILPRDIQILYNSTVGHNAGRHARSVLNHHFQNIGTIRKCSQSFHLHLTIFSILPLSLPQPSRPAAKRL